MKRPVRSLLHHPLQRHTGRDDEVPAEVWEGAKQGRGEIKRMKDEKERQRKIPALISEVIKDSTVGTP